MTTKNTEQISELLIKGMLISTIIDNNHFVVLSSASENINFARIDTANVSPGSIVSVFKEESYAEFVSEDKILPEWRGHIPAAAGVPKLICKSGSHIHSILSAYEGSYGIPVLLMATLDYTSKHPPVTKEEIEAFCQANRIDTFISVLPVFGPSIGSGGVYHQNGKYNK